MVVGGTNGLDGTHVDAAHGKGVGKRGMVHDGGQGLCARQSGQCLWEGLAQWRERGSGCADGGAFCAAGRRRVDAVARATAGGKVSAATGAPGLDTQARKPGETTAGNT